jgi:hypothetical protein
MQAPDMTASKKSAARKPAGRKSTSKKVKRRRHSQARQTEAPTRLKLRRPDDLLAMIPYLIGFHPEEDLVTVFVKSGRVRLTTRTDLPPDSAGEEFAEWIDALAKREGAEALALVAYSAASLPAHRLLTRLMDRLDDHELIDVLYVGHGKWWSLTCGDDCCPLAGTPLDLSSHPVSATAVVAGLNVRDSRLELEASVCGPDQQDWPRLDALARRLLQELEQLDDAAAATRLMTTTIEAALADPTGIDQTTGMLLGVLVTDLHRRDLAWALITPATADDHVRLWSGVVAHVPPILAAAPLCLLGMAGWISGSGALLNCCCDRLSRINPQYSMGRLLSEISERAIPPTVWQEIMNGTPAELDAEGALVAG